jgi:hypothetical protein
MQLSPASNRDAGWSSLVARRAHNPKVACSNHAPATEFFRDSGAHGSRKVEGPGDSVARAVGRECEGAQDAHQDGPGLWDIGVECREQILGRPGDRVRNTRLVTDASKSWVNYPFTTPTLTSQNCSAWGCTQMGCQMWWLNHMPNKGASRSNGNVKNWWKYIIDFAGALRELGK